MQPFYVYSRAIYGILFLMILPFFFWIGLDRSIWGWDRALYGIVSIELFETLIGNSQEWFSKMLHAIGSKPPIIVWLGQFIVYLGSLGGSVDFALLSLIIFFSYGTLILANKAFLTLFKQRSVALIACLSLVSAPSFVRFSKEFMVEVPQTFAVIWFVWIVSLAPKKNRIWIFSHLLGATALAMLAKASSPLYCFGPGLVILLNLFRPRHQTIPFIQVLRLNRSTLVWVLLPSIFLSIAVGLWYGENISSVLRHIQISSTLELWGKERPFDEKIVYWLGAIRHSFWLNAIFYVLIALLLMGALWKTQELGKPISNYFYLRFFKQSIRLNYQNLCVVVSVFNVLLVLAVFSFNNSEEARFLLPLLPHLVIIFAWILSWLKINLLNYSVIFLLIVQWGVVNGHALGAIAPTKHWAGSVRVVQTQMDRNNYLNKIFEETCSEEENGHTVYIGVDYSWLNLQAIDFFARKRFLNQVWRCTYKNVAWQTDLDRAWQQVFKDGTVYFVTAKPHLMTIDKPNNLLEKAILDKLQTSPFFELVNHSMDSNILLFKSIVGKKVNVELKQNSF